MLKHITFTGIGVDTDFNLLRELQDTYPFIEWGVLMSKNWANNGPRYFDPSKLEMLRGLGLKLSCHACGSLAYEALNNNWDPLRELTQGSLDIFSRCQLNISNKQPRENTPKLRPPQELDEVIIQQKNADNLEAFNCIENKENISVILDASGGHGVDTPIEIMKMDGVKVGYAGGMNPDNVYGKMKQLFTSDCGDFWIDMESGVRTDDIFDIAKVISVMMQYKAAAKECMFEIQSANGVLGL